MFVPLVGVHKDPNISYLAIKLASCSRYVFDTIENCQHQHYLETHQEPSELKGDTATITKRYTSKPPACFDGERERFRDAIRPHLPNIKHYLVETFKKTEDLDNPKSLKTLVSNDIISHEKNLGELKATGDLFLELAGEAALEDDIYNALIPEYEELIGYNPVKLLYLISDHISNHVEQAKKEWRKQYFATVNSDQSNPDVKKLRFQ